MPVMPEDTRRQIGSVHGEQRPNRANSRIGGADRVDPTGRLHDSTRACDRHGVDAATRPQAPGADTPRSAPPHHGRTDGSLPLATPRRLSRPRYHSNPWKQSSLVRRVAPNNLTAASSARSAELRLLSFARIARHRLSRAPGSVVSAATRSPSRRRQARRPRWPQRIPGSSAS
jgi:hypothetical protein